MKRILVDYKKLSHEVAALLIETYPHGYGDGDIIAFKNAQGEIIETVELRTEDTLYLVKISKNLSNFIANFEDAIEKELETKSPGILEEVNSEDVDAALNADQDFDEETDMD
ncbi:hypothetical protein [Spongiimicrobium sp. 3-5]|uniref:hypothetical protein n=1 Tax=Spongiimicrobium sp. 3-5 TaxID=3332596 RepID=UPI003980B84A